MRHATLVFALLAAVSTSPLTAAITGTVIAPDGSALQGTRVRAFQRETSDVMRRRVLSANPERVPVAAAETNEKGAFAVETGGAAVVDVIFEAEGRSITLLDAADGEMLDPVILREAKPLRGRVTAGGKPVAGAVLIHAGALTTHTDANGDYVLPGQARPAGVRVVHPSYAQTWIHPARNTQPDARLSPGTSLRGRVVGADGKPVANASLTLDGWPLGTSGEDGSFRIEHAWPQWHSLVAEEGSRTGWVSRIAKGDLTITLRRGATVSGVVRDEQGKAVPGVNVSANQAGGGGIFRPAMSDAKGRYSLERVLPGTYLIGGARTGYTTRPSDVRVAEDGRIERNITVVALPRLSGIVIDEQRKPVGGVEIESQYFESSTVTGADGRFRTRLPRLDGGQRFVLARKPGYALTRFPVSEAATNKDATVVLERGFPLEISVIDQKRMPVVDEPITLMLNGSDFMDRLVICGENRLDCRTDASGSFRVQLIEGAYDVAAGGARTVMRRLPAERLNADRKRLVIDVERAVSVSGRVVNADGSPATPPMVVIVKSGDQEEAPFTSPTRAAVEEDGSFTLSGVPAGPLMLMAGLMNGPPTYGPAVETNAPANGVELVGPRLMRVAGQVIDRATSQPVREFSVSVRRYRGGGAAGMNHAFHTEDGQFVIDRIPAAAAFDLLVTAPGYAPATVGDANLDKADPQPVTVKMEPGATLRVRVTAGGRAVQGARVMVQGDGGQTFARPSLATTADDGTMVFESLSTGNYAVLVSRKGYVAKRKTVELAEPKEARVDVELEAGKEVRGVVTDDSGRPVAQARVEPATRRFSGSPDSVTTTDSEGAFLLEGLDDAALTITASKNGFISAHAENVRPGGGARVTLTLKRGGTISGRVIGAAADEMRMIRVVAGGQGLRSDARPDASGTFTLTGVPDGRVSVSAVITSSSSRQTAEQTVEVTNGTAPVVELEFKSGIGVRGRVTRGGAPVPDVQVSFMPKAGPNPWRGEQRTFTTSDGRFEANVPNPGEYTVSVTSRGTPYHAGSLTVSSPTTFDIDMRGGAYRGRVVDAQTKTPVSGAVVFLQRKESSVGSSGITTDADGQFSYDTVAAGAYALRASKQGYVTFAQSVEVTDSVTAPVEIALERGQQLSIRVVDAATGKPLDRVVIQIRDAENRYAYSGVPMSDEAGVMSVALNPGRYKLTAMMGGEHPAQTVDVSVPGPEVLVRLSRGGKVAVSGTVSGAVGMRLISTTNATRYGQRQPPGRFENVAAGSYRLEVMAAKGVVLSTRPVVVTSGVTTTVALE